MTAPTASQVIATAASQIGGYFPGASPYGSWYERVTNTKGFASAAFCAMGLSWVFAQHEGGSNLHPVYAYTPSGVNIFKARGQWHAGTAGIRRGDVPFFDFPGAPNRVSHEAIVESVNSDGSVNTIEFNTSGTAAGDQRNGRVVARKRRKAYIVGYGRPAYGAGAPVVSVPDNRPRNADGSLTIACDGIEGPATIGRQQEVMGTPIDFVLSKPSTNIAAIQRMLNRNVGPEHIQNLIGAPSLKPDGYEGPKTILVLQFWLYNTVSKDVQIQLTGSALAWDSEKGPKTIKVKQWALNHSRIGAGQFPS